MPYQDTRIHPIRHGEAKPPRKSFMLEKVTSGIVLASLVVGCANVNQTSQIPAPAVPQRYKNADAQSTNNLPHRWWRIYRDEKLNALVEAALQDNPYTQIGRLRLVAARAQVQGADADRMPYAGASAGVSNSRTSVNTPLGTALGGNTISGNKFTLGFDFAWQFDVWKRIAHAVEAANAKVGMEQAFSDMVRLVLSSEVVVTYWQYRAAESDLVLLTAIRDKRAETESLLAERLNAGLINELDLARARLELANTEAEVEEARKRRSLAEHELATLVVKPLAEFSLPYDTTYQFPSLPVITPGLPASVLGRRPDLMESTQNIRALLAQKEIAETAFYPSIGLTGNFGLASTELKDLLQAGSRQFSLGPIAISLPIFDGGKNRANLAAAEAHYQEAINLHQSKLLIALREVDDALTEIKSYEVQMRAQRESLLAAGRVSLLAKSRYEKGMINYLEVANSEREALAARRKLLQSHAQALLATVRLVGALGGGWDNDENKGDK